MSKECESAGRERATTPDEQRELRARNRELFALNSQLRDRLEQLEESLRESESRFRELADGLPLMVWVHDATGTQELVNQTFCEFFGTHAGEMEGARWRAFVHPDDAETCHRQFRACFAEKRSLHAEARVKHADGTWRWIESWARPRLTPGGQFRGLVGASAEISDRRRAEEVLRDSEERFRTLADNITQLVWMAHGDGWTFWYNKRWYEYTGTTLEQMEGWGWRAAHHPDQVDRVVARVRNCVERGEPWEETSPLRGADGEYRWFLSRAVPIRNHSGAVVRWFGTHTDVTEQRAVEEKLVQADRQKDEFLAMLGHELRNPLAAIRSASELLKLISGGDSRIVKTQLVLERQTAHMVKLLDGLLDISRIIRGKITLEPELLDFVALCRTVTNDVTERLARRRLAIHTVLPPRPIWVEADRVRLSQMVDNLLSNAVKYTPDGGAVTLAVGSEDGMAALEVSDNGIGIEPGFLPHIFEIFRQAEQGIDRAYGGLGLGLALVKSLAELHGGTVEARSEGNGRGAQFVLRIPLSGPGTPRAPEAIQP